jgi:hypothetical protein
MNPGSNVQLILFQEYNNARTTDNIECPAWDGKKGGVIVLYAEDTLYLQHQINASGKGFIGGKSMNASTTVLAHNDILFAEQDSTLFH